MFTHRLREILRLVGIKCRNGYYQCNSTLKKKDIPIGEVIFFHGISDSFHVIAIRDWEDEFLNSWLIQCVRSENIHLYSYLETGIGFL